MNSIQAVDGRKEVNIGSGVPEGLNGIEKSLIGKLTAFGSWLSLVTVGSYAPNLVRVSQ